MQGGIGTTAGVAVGPGEGAVVNCAVARGVGASEGAPADATDGVPLGCDDVVGDEEGEAVGDTEGVDDTVGAAVVHTPESESSNTTQTLSLQSVFMTQACPTRHLLHEPPPQSNPVSSPLRIPSMQDVAKVVHIPEPECSNMAQTLSLQSKSTLQC